VVRKLELWNAKIIEFETIVALKAADQSQALQQMCDNDVHLT
jgi:hypothetical protein